MRKETLLTPAQNQIIFTEAVADIVSRIEQYSFNAKHLLTIEFGILHKSPNELTKDLHHIDRVIESFIHRGKWHNDTPGRIYFIEPHADRGYHVHIVMEELPSKTMKYYADKLFLHSPETEKEIAEQESRIIEQLGAHLRKYVKRIAKSKRAFNSKKIFDIDGLTRYLNKSCFNPRVEGADHIDYMNGSIFNPQWIQNRLNTLTGAN